MGARSQWSFIWHVFGGFGSGHIDTDNPFPPHQRPVFCARQKMQRRSQCNCPQAFECDPTPGQPVFSRTPSQNHAAKGLIMCHQCVLQKENPSKASASRTSRDLLADGVMTSSKMVVAVVCSGNKRKKERKKEKKEKEPNRRRQISMAHG